VIEAQAHLAGCESCQHFMRDMRALGEAVHDAAPRERAPAEVRSRLFTAIARARAGMQPLSFRRVRPSWVAAAAVLVAIAGGAITAERLLRVAPNDPLSALVADHAGTVVGAHIVSSDPAEIGQWLARQVHFAMHVPVLPGARLRGARICIMDGRRGAVVEYEVDQMPVSYFVVPNELTHANDADVSGFDRAVRAGYRIVSWQEPGLLHAMVGDLPESRLASLAEACVEQAQRAMAWLRGQLHSIYA
jgi:anti-sigma factor RsiW